MPRSIRSSAESSAFSILLLTALAPALWGANYAITTEFLPPDRPLLVSTMRALPTGLLMLLLVRRLPRGSWWWKSAVLGFANIGVFFALLFVSIYRLPGGVAAMMGAMQPIAVLLLSALVLGIAPRAAQVGAALLGVAGVGLLVLRSDAQLDAIGLLAGLGGVASMSLGMVLAKRWSDPDVSPLVSTTWQLIAGGIFLVPFTAAIEGAPPSPTLTHLAAFGFVGIIATGFACWLWMRGVELLPPARTSFLALLTPLVAGTIGWIALGESLTPLQLVGAAIALAGVVLGARMAGRVPESNEAADMAGDDRVDSSHASGAERRRELRPAPDRGVVRA